MSDNLWIVTGAPGTGKTAILEAVNADVRSIAEPARVEVCAAFVHASIRGD